MPRCSSGDSVRLTVKRGDDFYRTFQWRENGAMVDLGFATARMQLRKANSRVPVVEASEENNWVTVEPEVGEVNVLIPAEVTARLPTGTYEADLEMLFESGIRQSTVTFYIEILPDVTRDYYTKLPSGLRNRKDVTLS